MRKEKLSKAINRDSILQDLEKLYQEALAQENLSIALKIKELQGKAIGLFTPTRLSTLDPKALSDGELEELIKQLS